MYISEVTYGYQYTYFWPPLTVWHTHGGTKVWEGDTGCLPTSGARTCGCGCEWVDVDEGVGVYIYNY